MGRARDATAVKDPSSYALEACSIQRSDHLCISCVPYQQAASAVAPMSFDDDQITAARMWSEIPHPSPGAVPIDGDFFQDRAVRVYGVPTVVFGIRGGFVRIADVKDQPLVTDPFELQYVGIGEIRHWAGDARVHVQ